MLLIDRCCAALGARRLVQGRPRMGWLLVEVVPVFVWAQVCGALAGESFYLVTYLGLLGADDAALALLPLVAGAGNAMSALLVSLRPTADPKRRCVVDTGVARVLWLGTLIGPALGLWCGWPPWLMIGTVLASVFSTHLFHLAGGSGFSVWTQAVVPTQLRGHFWAWRNLASFGSVGVVSLALGALLPRSGEATAADLPLMMGTFAVLTALCIASTWWLAKAPDMPAEIAALPRRPWSDAWAASRGVTPYLTAIALGLVATAITVPYLPLLLHQRGVVPGAFALLQGVAFFPAMLLGILSAGWLLGRIGGQRLLLLACAAMAVGDSAFLLLPAQPSHLTTSILAAALALSGLAKGLLSIAVIGRQQEICPAGDVRFPALITGVGALATMSCAALLFVSVPASTDHAATTGDAWPLVAIAVGVRVLVVVWLVSGRRDPIIPPARS